MEFQLVFQYFPNWVPYFKLHMKEHTSKKHIKNDMVRFALPNIRIYHKATVINQEQINGALKQDKYSRDKSQNLFRL